ncbi:MAG: DUF2232 domain-containing protein [Longimicrobiales bacterium]
MRQVGPGWGRVAALAVTATVLSVVPATLLVFLPMALMMVALPPRRPAAIVGGVAGLVALLVTGPADPIANFTRGWALVAGAWFVIAAVILERPGFVARGLIAVGGAAATSGALLAFRPGSFAGLDGLVRDRTEVADSAARALGDRFGIGSEVAEALRQRTEVTTLLQPALLVLATLAALAVGWWVYRRLSARDASPLADLAQFRFPDALVWVLIGGIVLRLVPAGELAARAGSNLVALMAMLYALRGAAVLVFLHGMPGVVGWLILGVLGLLLLPLVLVPALIVGLSDTWLDIRSRRHAEEDAGP